MPPLILPTHTDPSGNVWKLGNRPTPAHLIRPRVRAAAPIDRSTWREFEYDPAEAGIKIRDQGAYGACNGHASISSLEWARWIAGLPHVDLSAWFVYAILCNGDDQGSSIGEALQLLEQTGTCPNEDVPWGTINPRAIPTAARAAAARFRIERGEALTTFDEMMEACQLRRPFNASICADGNFSRLDADGCPPVTPGYGDHAVCGGIGAKRAANGEWVIKFQNSWTDVWGIRGCFWYRRGHIETQGGFDAYEVIAVQSDPDEAGAPPVVVA